MLHHHSLKCMGLGYDDNMKRQTFNKLDDRGHVHIGKKLWSA